MMKTLLAIFMGGLLACAPALAETIIPGGDVTGTWTAAGSPYLIQGEITVPVGGTLTITHGVAVIFQGNYRFFVRGRLYANGIVSDSIRFYAATPTNVWGGIKFVNAPDFSHLFYCLIKDGKGSDCWNKGGGVYCEYSNPLLVHCTIRENSTNYLGGGISCLHAQPNIAYCTISDNRADLDGGGIYLDSSSAQISNCTISYNTSGGNGGGIVTSRYSNATIINTVLSHNGADGYGGGIACELSNPNIKTCLIDSNTADLGGGGMRCTLYSNPTVDSTIIYANTTDGYGGGICLENYATSNIKYCVIAANLATGSGGGIHSGNYCMPTINHCTIRSNSASEGGGISCAEWGPALTNSIVESNLGNGGLYFSAGQTYGRIKYNDIYNNGVANYAGTFIPLWLGVLTRSNLNGDSCDQFYNISLNPLFVDPTNDDLCLQWGSPCIDAGDPTSALDPDGTTTDLGALPFDHASLPSVPQIGVSTLALSYGSVWIYGSSTKPLSIYNTGDTTLVLYNLTSSNPAAFAVNWNIADSLIQPGDSLTVQVVFHPPVATFYGENLTIDNNDVQINVVLLGSGTSTGISDRQGEIPLSFDLEGPYPNPFNPNTTFTLSLPKAVDVNLSVFDINGRLLTSVLTGRHEAGIYPVSFEGVSLPSGVYLYRLQAGEYSANGKMVLLK